MKGFIISLRTLNGAHLSLCIQEGMCELKVHVEFSGGAELLVGKVKHHDLVLPGQPHPWSLRQLIAWIRDNLLKVNIIILKISF